MKCQFMLVNVKKTSSKNCRKGRKSESCQPQSECFFIRRNVFGLCLATQK